MTPKRVLGAALIAAAFWSLACVAEAATPDYRYWYTYAQTKIYPETILSSTGPRASDTTPPMMALGAAKAEFEGRQVVLRPNVAIQDVWLQPSVLTCVDESGTVNTISASSVTTYKVNYIRITTPSYGYTRRGYEPDSLLPMTLANGEKLGWLPNKPQVLALRSVPANSSRSFYVLFHVPENSAAGTYAGTIRITATDLTGTPAPEVTIPVSLQVYPFSVARTSLRTAFGFDTGAPKRNTASGTWLSVNPSPGPGAARVPETNSYHGDQVAGWMRYLDDHRISPYYMTPTFEQRSSNGTMSARHAVLTDYLGTGPATTFLGSRFGFNSIKLPTDSVTSWINNPFASSTYTSNAIRYYRSVASELGVDVSKAYVFPKDEPKASQMPFVKRYAAFIHKYVPGLKFLLTTDASTQKGALVPGVDIYVYRSHFIFRDWSYILKIRSARKPYWIYTAKTIWQKNAPNYLLDKPLTDPRAEGWLAFRTRASGLLYYSVNNYSGKDPYVTQLTTIWAADGHTRYANGDASLIYPGFYPRLGLVVEGAPPVGSLRMEALRDGLEDHEYLQLVSQKLGTVAADSYAARIIGPTPPRLPGKLQFPKYTTSVYYYEAVRRDMAAALSR